MVLGSDDEFDQEPAADRRSPIWLDPLGSSDESETEHGRSERDGGLPDGWRPVDESKWNIELLRAMDWKLFEALCAEAFRRSGCQVTLDRDVGIDFLVNTPAADVV